MDRPCRIELLGTLRVHHGERVITRFHTYKTGAMLAWLAYTRMPQVREVVIEMLWPENPLDRGRNNLSVALSSLRNQLEPPGVPSGGVLIADRLTVGLNPDTVVTDTAEFEALLKTASEARGDAERCQMLVQAADLYRGELLPGYYQEWILPERQRLTELYLQALRQLVRLLARRKDLVGAIDIARRAVAADPRREEAHHDLVRLLLAARQPSAALRQYREFEQALLDGRGERPSPASLQLLQKIESDLRDAQERPAAALPALSTVAQPSAPVTAPPTGTITFLLLDTGVPGWQTQRSEATTDTLYTCEALVTPLVQRHGGHLLRQPDETLQAAFTRAGAALECAIACRYALDARAAKAGIPGIPDPRMAIHTGETELQRGKYQGSGPDHAARLLAAAHRGQILCSEATAGLLGLFSNVDPRLADLGVYRLRGQAAAERLFQVETPGSARQEFPAPDADTVYSDTLPLQFTRFFGREQELARLEEMLRGVSANDTTTARATDVRTRRSEARLVTITGPGGTGKTRLALEVARRIQTPLSGAVWFVPLADLREAGLIPGAIADALRLPRSREGDPLEQAIERLSRQTSVLILDNFEHLVEAGAAIIRTLLARVPTLRCLVTSRHAVKLAGERTFPLEPLATPRMGDTPERLCLYESVQLFIDRAQAVRPDFQVTSTNAAAVATLCDRLEGMPLAIELAAARAAVLTPAQMLAQLQNLFDFLVSRYRDADERHRTLRATMEWSFLLLSAELQRFFARLSVFRGGWTEVEAEAVCEEPLALDYLAQLRECSLVTAQEQGPTMRFRMLEMVRQYGAEKLEAEEAGRLRLRHAEAYLMVVRRLDARIRSGDRTAITAGQVEMDNLRESVRWACVMEAHALTAEFARSVGRIWIQVGAWDEFIVRAPALRRSLQHVSDSQGEARLLDLCANIVHRQSRHDEALRYASEALALWRACGHDRMAAPLSNMAWYAFHAGGPIEAQRLAAESLALARASDDREAIGFSLAVQADVALARGDTGEARTLTEEAKQHFEAIDDRAGVAIALERMGTAEQLAGAHADARRHYVEALDLLRGLGYRFGVANILFRLSTLIRDRDPEVAKALFALSARIDRELGAPNRRFAEQERAIPAPAAPPFTPCPTSETFSEISYEEELDRLLEALQQSP